MYIMHIYIYVCINEYMYVCILYGVCVYIYIYLYTYIALYIYTYMHVYCIIYIYIYIYIYMPINKLDFIFSAHIPGYITDRANRFRPGIENREESESLTGKQNRVHVGPGRAKGKSQHIDNFRGMELVTGRAQFGGCVPQEVSFESSKKKQGW
jgi:hypothetical protein